MDRPESVTITIVLLLLALLGMYLGWRARQRRQSALPVPDSVPADPGASLFTAETLYAATTLTGDPLNRIAVRGLGFRGRATVTVTERGVILGIAGTPEVFLPIQTIRSVQRATWTIDRVVESGGLVCISWTLGETDVDSYLRVTETADPAPLIRAIAGILPAKAAS
jgi:hypothetical protein